MGSVKKGPRFIGHRHEIADRNIRRYKEALDAALRGESTANPDICREKIDQWLEYRLGPNDARYL